MLIDWEYYSPDTWAGEDDIYLFIIKKVEDDSYAYVFGTESDVMVSGVSADLSEAQAIANRWSWLVNNVTPDRVGALLFKL